MKCFGGPESIFGKLFEILGNPEKQLNSPFSRISMFFGFLERPPPQCVFSSTKLLGIGARQPKGVSKLSRTASQPGKVSTKKV